MAFKKDIPLHLKVTEQQDKRIRAACERAGGVPVAAKFRELMMNWVAESEKVAGIVVKP